MKIRLHFQGVFWLLSNILKALELVGRGRGGIRTHGTLAGTPVFKTGALNHSATLPSQEFQSLSVGLFRTQRELGPDLDPKASSTEKSAGDRRQRRRRGLVGLLRSLPLGVVPEQHRGIV